MVLFTDVWICVWIVFEILLAYVQNHDWEQAFRGVIPERKVLTKEVASEDDDPEYSHTPTPDSNDARTH